MDKTSVIGYSLIGVVLVGSMWLNKPSEAEVREQARQDSIAAVRQQTADAAAAQARRKAEEARRVEAEADTTSLFHENLVGKARTVVLKNKNVRLTLSTRGGVVEQAEVVGGIGIKGGRTVTLFDRKSASLGFLLSGKTTNIDTRQMYFEPVAATDTSVTMRLGREGRCLDIRYTLPRDSYMLTMTIAGEGIGGQFAPTTQTMDVVWAERVRQQEKGFDFENRYSEFTYKVKDDDVDNFLNKTKELDEPLDWVAFKNQFFSCILIAHQDFTHATLVNEQYDEPTHPVRGESILKLDSAQMKTLFDPTGARPTQLQLYVGPNDFHHLQATNAQGTVKKDLNLEGLVYFGWPVVRWINRFFILYLFDWLTQMGLHMGLVLLLLTVIVKALVYPATKKSFLSSARMRVLKPKVDELAKKYPNKEDAMKKQQETMQLYSQYGVSPMGGCLPMLIQMPIWIALFNFIPNAIQLRGESFLWADDLSAYDDLISWGPHIWGIGNHLSIFCILFTLTNIGNTIISMRQQKNQMMSDEQAAQMKMMQYMMFLMPLMFFFVFNGYSSGLSYYYFLSGLSSIFIMWLLKKTTDDKKLLASLEAYRAKRQAEGGTKMSGMAARLQEMQRKAEEMQRQQQQRKK